MVPNGPPRAAWRRAPGKAAAHDGGGEVRRAADAVDGNAHVVDLEPQLSLHGRTHDALMGWLVAAASRSNR